MSQEHQPQHLSSSSSCLDLFGTSVDGEVEEWDAAWRPLDDLATSQHPAPDAAGLTPHATNVDLQPPQHHNYHLQDDTLQCAGPAASLVPAPVMNSALDSAHGASKRIVKNVTWERQRGRYRATLYLKTQRVHIGWFTDQVAAAHAADLAQLSLKGATAALKELNFGPENYVPGSQRRREVEALVLGARACAQHRRQQRARSDGLAAASVAAARRRRQVSKTDGLALQAPTAEEAAMAAAAVMRAVGGGNEPGAARAAGCSNKRGMLQFLIGAAPATALGAPPEMPAPGVPEGKGTVHSVPGAQGGQLSGSAAAPGSAGGLGSQGTVQADADADVAVLLAMDEGPESPLEQPGPQQHPPSWPHAAPPRPQPLPLPSVGSVPPAPTWPSTPACHPAKPAGAAASPPPAAPHPPPPLPAGAPRFHSEGGSPGPSRPATVTAWSCQLSHSTASSSEQGPRGGPQPPTGRAALQPPHRRLPPASAGASRCAARRRTSGSGRSAGGLPVELVRMEGYTGVFWHTGEGKYRAYSSQVLDGGVKKKVKLGSFSTPEEAARMYDGFVLGVHQSSSSTSGGTASAPCPKLNFPQDLVTTYQPLLSARWSSPAHPPNAEPLEPGSHNVVPSSPAALHPPSSSNAWGPPARASAWVPPGSAWGAYAPAELQEERLPGPLQAPVPFASASCVQHTQMAGLPPPHNGRGYPCLEQLVPMSTECMHAHTDAVSALGPWPHLQHPGAMVGEGQQWTCGLAAAGQGAAHAFAAWGAPVQQTSNWPFPSHALDSQQQAPPDQQYWCPYTHTQAPSQLPAAGVC